MVTRAMVRDWLLAYLNREIDQEALVEAFCQYTEDDYYEWLKDNFNSFFDHGDPDWEWIRQKIALLHTAQK